MQNRNNIENMGKKMEIKAIQTDTYFSKEEITAHLKNVEYIIMATPAPKHFHDTPIHFTIFLNTQEALPQDIQKAVLEKFLKENSITEPKELLSKLMQVGFSQSTQETPMPLLLIKPEDIRSIPSTSMFVMDFLANSNNFTQVKQESLTGWSYSYSH